MKGPVYRMISGIPTAKVWAAGSGAGVGGAIAVLVIYGFEEGAARDLPVYVEIAVTTLCTAAAAIIGGWLKRPAERDQIERVR